MCDETLPAMLTTLRYIRLGLVKDELRLLFHGKAHAKEGEKQEARRRREAEEEVTRMHGGACMAMEVTFDRGK